MRINDWKNSYIPHICSYADLGPSHYVQTQTDISFESGQAVVRQAESLLRQHVEVS
jgi:hypothetical protein